MDEETRHLSDAEVSSWKTERLAKEYLERVAAHIESCTVCSARVDDIAGVETKHELIRAAVREHRIARSASVGRYVVLDVLGEGGMGVVYSAYDPELDRKVAVKLLHAADDPAWLLREAQALARLSHPNVVTVHDVGTLPGDRVFVAMELVEGATLREWMKQAIRDWRDVLPIMIAAGVGLAAAHAAGLVHRDFKPDNVLVGRDGRVRVMDFGLARLQAGVSVRPDSESETALAKSPLRDTLTIDGSVRGTPTYMAPELFAGKPADARSDQFAFGVALYEVLFGTRPFSSQELAAAPATPLRPKQPAKTNVPAGVQRVVMRAIAEQPDERYPSMDALLAALPVDRRSRAIISTLLGGVAAASLTLAAVHFTDDDTSSPCQRSEAQLAGLWDVSVQQRIRASLLASQRSHAASTFDRIDHHLRSYAAEWLTARQTICEATHVRHEQSDLAFDFRMACLAERLDEARAYTSLFSTVADRQLADKAVIAAQRLPRPERCISILPGAETSATADERQLAEVLRREAAQVRAYRDTNKLTLGLDKAHALVARARSDTPLAAELLLLLGQLQSELGKAEEAEKSLREVVRLAARAKDDRLSAQAWTLLVRVVGFQRGNYAAALALEPVAEAEIVRAGGDAALAGELTMNVGSTHLLKGEYVRALTAYEASLAIRTKLYGETHPDVAAMHNNVGVTLIRQGEYERASHHFTKAMSVYEQVLGRDHPDIALPLGNLGAIAQQQRRFDDADRYFERALRMLEEVHGSEHPNVGITVMNLGYSARDRGDCTKALPYFTRALGIFEKLGPTHPYIAHTLVGRAHCNAELDQSAGIADAERAIEILQSQTSDPAQVAEARFALARAIWKREPARARKLATDARATFVASGAAAKASLVQVDEWLAKH